MMTNTQISKIAAVFNKTENRKIRLSMAALNRAAKLAGFDNLSADDAYAVRRDADRQVSAHLRRNAARYEWARRPGKFGGSVYEEPAATRIDECRKVRVERAIRENLRITNKTQIVVELVDSASDMGAETEVTPVRDGKWMSEKRVLTVRVCRDQAFQLCDRSEKGRIVAYCGSAALVMKNDGNSSRVIMVEE